MLNFSYPALSPHTLSPDALETDAFSPYALSPNALCTDDKVKMCSKGKSYGTLHCFTSRTRKPFF